MPEKPRDLGRDQTAVRRAANVEHGLIGSP
jgi:hypothetical protein